MSRGDQLKTALTSWPVAALATGLMAIAFYLAWHGQTQVDFRVYMMGGHAATTGRLYQLALPTGQPFTYPPFAALLFLPLAELPFRVADGLWVGLNVVALVAAIEVSLRLVRPELDRRLAFRLAMLISLPALWLEPMWLTMIAGQVSFILMWLVLWDVTRAEPNDDAATGAAATEHSPLRRRLPIGVATGIAAAIKLTPLVFIVYLMLTRRLRAGLVAAATFVVCAGLAFVASPSASLQYWTKEVFNTGRFGSLYTTFNQSLLSALGRFSHEAVSNRVVLVTSVLVGIAGLGLAVYARRRSSPALGLIVCAGTGLLISPVTWSYHMVWVIVLMIWLVAGSDRPRYGIWFAAVVGAIYWSAPILDVPRPAFMYGDRHPIELHATLLQLLEGNSFFLTWVVALGGIAVLMLYRSGVGSTRILHPFRTVRGRISARVPAVLTLAPWEWEAAPEPAE